MAYPADSLIRCAYCESQPAETHDHVIPRSMRRHWSQRRKLEGRPRIPRYLLGTVPSCYPCNIRKGARRLVPPSWAEYVDALNDFFGGVPWRVWRGTTSERAYTAVHR